jgi:hypothetical protein
MVECPICGATYNKSCEYAQDVINNATRSMDLDDHLTVHHGFSEHRETVKFQGLVHWEDVAKFMERPEFKEWVTEAYALKLLGE